MLRAQDLDPQDRLWALVLAVDVGLGSGDPRLMREAAEEAAALDGRVDDRGVGVIVAVYDALADLRDAERACDKLAEAADLARALGEPGLERLARGYRMVPLRLLGRTPGLDDEARALTEAGCGNDYDRYICIWAASLLAMVDRDGPRLRGLMDAQLLDLMSTGLHENWLTMYWGALGQVCNGEDYLPQLRRARRRAEAEGRSADADCVLALGYAAACRDGWEQAAELLGPRPRSCGATPPATSTSPCSGSSWSGPGSSRRCSRPPRPVVGSSTSPVSSSTCDNRFVSGISGPSRGATADESGDQLCLRAARPRCSGAESSILLTARSMARCCSSGLS